MSPCLYPLLLSIHLPNLPKIYRKIFRDRRFKRPFMPVNSSLGRWVLPAHDFKVLLDEATNLLDTKVAPQSATGNPRETPVTRANLFEGFFLLNHQDPLRIPLKKRLCFLGFF